MKIRITRTCLIRGEHTPAGTVMDADPTLFKALRGADAAVLEIEPAPAPVAPVVPEAPVEPAPAPKKSKAK